MKNYIKYILFSLLVIVVISLLFFKKSLKAPSKAAMNFISCISSDFISDDEIDQNNQMAPMLLNLGTHTYKISTLNKDAQKYFNQGLNLLYAFNFSEAHRSFIEVSKLDPNNPMGFWGQAYALGPNINDSELNNERNKRAYKAIGKALKLITNASEKEKSLIHALSFRYRKRNRNREASNMAYMKEMQKVSDLYPNDIDIRTLLAASVLNTTPWNYWNDHMKPQENIPIAVDALTKALEMDPYHPGANHYYIHLVEFPKPELGLKSAQTLEKLNIDSGHLTHMPSHIYMRLGQYEDAIRVNKKAILADESYISQCIAQGQYPLSYYPHNIHFLWSSASMLGDIELAIDAAKKVAEKVPMSELKESSQLQTFAASPILAYVRFGKWNEILTIPDPGDEFTLLKLYWHYARGIAFVRKGNLKEANEELDFLNKRDRDLSQENIAKVAFEVLSGEIAAANENFKEAIVHLEAAVLFEDELGYMEPSFWHIPTRQSLGAILLKAKQLKKAEQVYLDDLSYYQKNVWSLAGLYKSLSEQNKIDEATEVKKQYDEALSKTTIQIVQSVF